MWPAIAGAVAFWLATRDASPHGWRHGLLASLTAGTVAGLISFVGASLTVLIGGNSAASPANVGGRLLIVMAAELGIAAVCLIVVATAVAGGVAMIPVRWLRPPRHGAPAA